MGLVSDITTDRFLPMYRMTQELVEWLRRPDDAAR